MITVDSLHVDSPRSISLWKKFCNKKYRDGYVSSHIKKFLAHQITALRGEKSQTEFGEIIGKPQSVVCRLESPNYGKYSLQTLLDVASKLNVALIVRFVDFPTFLKGTRDFSDEAIRPRAYEEQANMTGAVIDDHVVYSGLMESFTGGGASTRATLTDHPLEQHLRIDGNVYSMSHYRDLKRQRHASPGPDMPLQRELEPWHHEAMMVAK